jgi:hypothetical protein
MTDHDHYGDYAGERHRHCGLERDDETAQRDIRRLQQDVRELRALIEDAAGKLAARVRELEAQTPQAQRLQHEADLAAADLAESGYDRHRSHCQCPYCAADEPELTGPDYCPQTSDSRHCGDWHEGGRCGACGLTGPGPDDEPGHGPAAMRRFTREHPLTPASEPDQPEVTR